MLNSISWSDFFIAVGIVVIAYYAITILLLYSHEIKTFLKGKSGNAISEEQRDSATDVLGTTRSTVKPAAKAQPVSTPNDPEHQGNQPSSETSDEELLTGAVSDLLDEIKSKIKTLEGWRKDEVLSVFRELLRKYPQLIGTIYQESINHFIANSCSEHFPWSLEPEEVQPLWP